MRTFRDSKAMAKTLRAELARRETTLSHGACLDIVARQFGLENWNVLAARLSDAPQLAGERLTLPSNWLLAGTAPHLYDAGIDPTVTYGQGHPAVIRSRGGPDDPAYVARETVFATLMQSVVAEPFAGRRICLEAELRTHDVVGGATLWLRVDREPGRTLAFDNMEDRIQDGTCAGTQDWVRRCIILDVPNEAASLHFGFFLRGTGTAWASGFDLREAGAGETPTKMSRLLPRPTNLDFSEMRPRAS